MIPFEPNTVIVSEMTAISVLEEMPPNFDVPPYVAFGGETTEINLKFEIPTAGFYSIIVEILTSTGLSEHFNTLPASEVYTAEGELVPFAGPGLGSTFEVGTYILRLRWYEGEYALMAAFVLNQSDNMVP
jgi:hypothetical protein